MSDTLFSHLYSKPLPIMQLNFVLVSENANRYLYLCAATMCVYIGVLIIAATVVYTGVVLFVRTKNFNSKLQNFG